MLRLDDRVLVTGGTGLIGANLALKLRKMGHEVLSVGSETDLRDPLVAKNLFSNFRPTIVYHLAAKVGGIFANTNYKFDFYSDNVLINTNVVNSCAKSKDVRYIFAMGTGCAYPKRLEENILSEDDFLDGVPEVTNDAYAYAKRGLLVHLQALESSSGIPFVYCLPANIYGPFDNFHPLNSHVVPGLVRRFCDAVNNHAEKVLIWGDGTAKRDFLYIDDCVDAMNLLVNADARGVYNVCTNKLTSISVLADHIASSSKFLGLIEYDSSKPTGQMQRIFDTTKMDALGWRPKISLSEGINKTVEWFKLNKTSLREK